VSAKHEIRFLRSGRGKAQCPPDPNYPNGVRVSMAREGEEFCDVALPYPAPECGMWEVSCTECHSETLISAAGRADDPISVRLRCKAVIQ